MIEKSQKDIPEKWITKERQDSVYPASFYWMAECWLGEQHEVQSNFKMEC